MNNGVLTIRSSYSFKDTINQLESIFSENDITIFSKIDHAENARRVQLNLPKTVVFIFGNPNIGTLLMQENQQIALDLPSKLLVWEDERGNVWLSRNETSWLMERHQIKDNATESTLEHKINRIVKQVASIN